jgi:hypothetical protein
MPFVWNREVDRYRVEVFAGSSLNYERHIRLDLAADAGNPAHVVSIQFPVTRPADYVNIGSSFTTVQLPLSSFGDLYHVLQTESPVFFTAYEVPFGGTTLSFAGLTTDEEATGEGFRDANTFAGP